MCSKQVNAPLHQPDHPRSPQQRILSKEMIGHRVVYQRHWQRERRCRCSVVIVIVVIVVGLFAGPHPPLTKGLPRQRKQQRTPTAYQTIYCTTQHTQYTYIHNTHNISITQHLTQLHINKTQFNTKHTHTHTHL